MQPLTVKLEALMALLVTFLIAVAVMGALGGLSSLEMLVALAQGVAVFCLWERCTAPR